MFEQALTVAGTNYQVLCEETGEAILQIRDNIVVDINSAALKLFGFVDKASMKVHYPVDLSPPVQPDGVSSGDKGREMFEIACQKGNHCFEWLHATANQSIFWAEVRLTRISPEGAPVMYAMVRNITKRKETERACFLEAQVFELGRQAGLITDQARVIVSANRAFSEITGYTQQEVRGCLLDAVLYSLQDLENCQSIFHVVDTCGYWEGEAWDRKQNGQIYPQWLTITAVRGNNHEIANYFAVFSDITERKSLEYRTRHIAEHDFLTGLPNRILLVDRLRQAIASARRNNTQFALLFLDLDRFKFINDSMGHSIGDKLLQEVAKRLRKCVRAIDTVSRQGGDEFIILLADTGNAKQIAHVAQNVMNAIAQMFEIDSYEFSMTVCIGISTFPNDGEDMDTLIKHADIAMYYAKESGRNGYQFFNEEINARTHERNALERNLKKALEKGEFILHYQAEVDFASGRIVGAEALIRWDHPEMGRLLPPRFISAAEECGLIVSIGQWVLERACRQAKYWLDQGFPIVVSVNLSAAQFRQRNLLQNIADTLRLSGLEPRYLALEITESILLNGQDSIYETMVSLKELGVKLAIDDFGTGYSSLSYLKRIQVDKLKIDRSFVHEITHDPKDTEIIRAIVAMAKSLELKVVAEGVETAQQFSYLQSIGCDEYQGFYSSQSLSGIEFGQFRYDAGDGSLQSA